MVEIVDNCNYNSSENNTFDIHQNFKHPYTPQKFKFPQFRMAPQVLGLFRNSLDGKTSFRGVSKPIANPRLLTVVDGRWTPMVGPVRASHISVRGFRSSSLLPSIANHPSPWLAASSPGQVDTIRAPWENHATVDSAHMDTDSLYSFQSTGSWTSFVADYQAGNDFTVGRSRLN